MSGPLSKYWPCTIKEAMNVSCWRYEGREGSATRVPEGSLPSQKAVGIRLSPDRASHVPNGSAGNVEKNNSSRCCLLRGSNSITKWRAFRSSEVTFSFETNFYFAALRLMDITQS